MKIQCLLCKEIVEIGAFVSSDEGIRVQCASCRESFFLPRSGHREAATSAGPAKAASDEPATGEGECPKCGSGVGDELAACASCGLMRERFDSFASDAKREEDPALEALWSQCEASWDDVEAHERFVARASSTGAFATAARHYRLALKVRPADPVAEARLERVTKMAEVALLSKRPEAIDEPAGPYRGVVILLVLMLAIGGVAGIYALAKGKDADGVERKKPIKAAPKAPSRSTR